MFCELCSHCLSQLLQSTARPPALVFGAGAEDWTTVCSSATHSQAAERTIPLLCKQVGKCPTMVLRWLSRTTAVVGKVIPGGWVQVVMRRVQVGNEHLDLRCRAFPPVGQVRVELMPTACKRQCDCDEA